MSDFNYGKNEKDSFDYGKNKSLSTADNKQNLQTISPDSYVSIARQGMGMIRRFKFDKSNKEDLAIHASAITKKLLAMQRDSIEQQMENHFKAEKKRNLFAYQQEVARIDAAISRASDEIEKQLTTYMLEGLVNLETARESYSNRFESMANSGEISNEGQNRLNAMVSKWSDKMAGGLDYRLELLFKSYKDSFDRAVNMRS